MANSYTEIMASLQALESNLVELERAHRENGKAAKASHDAKAKETAKELKKIRAAMQQLSIESVGKSCVKKVEFMEAAYKLLEDNGGKLTIPELIGLTMNHLEEQGYSMSGLAMHADKYLRNDPRLTRFTDGLIGFSNTDEIDRSL